jgi:error-prone DNA polymerase
VQEGLTERFPNGVSDKVKNQIDQELHLISELEYEPYFLTVFDIVRFARSEGILCQGRGSAANSAVCYCLGITEIDPERSNLLFERFISRERNEPPDIDVDFEHQRREEVIQYIYRRYGHDRAAIAATVITYRTRSAIQDIGKALGLDIERIRRLSGSLAWWDKDDLAAVGLMKIDVLALGMLSAIRRTLDLVSARRGSPFRMQDIPAKDEKTFDMICKADTIGVFQIESRAQMATLPRMKPANFYDLVVEVAIIRPGPITGKMVHPYLNRRQGREPVTYPHPSLEPVLRRTLGVPLFQEQLLRVAMVAANFTGGEAEDLRRAMGFKRSLERMSEIEAKLRNGLRKNGIGAKAEEEIVRSITSFALYGFPESHAASFALLVYASSYLKAHYGAAFLAALLNCQPMGFYAPATLVKDAQRHGIRVRPVCVQSSAMLCTLEDDNTVRLGLRYVAGLRADAALAIQRERFSNGPFRSLQDFTHRTRLRKEELDTLAEIGALNPLDATLHRREALWQVARFGKPAGPLLEETDEDEALPEDSPLAAMSAIERVEADFRGTGLTTGPHPMRYLREELLARGISTAEELRRIRNGKRVKGAGVVIVRQRPYTAKGIVFLSLEDETGVSNIIVWPDLFEEYRLLWTTAPFVLIDGIVQMQDDVIHVKEESVQPLHGQQHAPESHDFH